MLYCSVVFTLQVKPLLNFEAKIAQSSHVLLFFSSVLYEFIMGDIFILLVSTVCITLFALKNYFVNTF